MSRRAGEASPGVWRHGVEMVAGVYLAVAAIGTWVAVREDLGGEPFGLDLPLTPLSGFVFGLGTALSAPLILLLALIAATILLGRGGRIRRRSATAIMVLGTGFFLGMLVEPIFWDLLGTGSFSPVTGAIVGANLLLPLLMLTLAIRIRANPQDWCDGTRRDG